MPEQIGFIGLGTMGKPMAENLWKAGFDLVVYNRNPERSRPFAGRERVNVAQSVADVAGKADIIFTMLTDDQAVEEIYLGDSGLLNSCRERGRQPLFVDSSTISPDTVTRIAGVLKENGIDYLDAPVTGSEPQAIEGVLTFIVGGERNLYERLLPCFEAMGKKAVYMGPVGSGAQAKLANNLLVAITLTGLAESMSMVQKAGGSPERFLEVVAGGGARSGMAEMKGPKILERDFHPQFMAKLMHKDLKLAAKFAEQLQLPAPVLNVVKEQFQIACASGHGDEDMCAVVRNYENWAKVVVGGQKEE